MTTDAELRKLTQIDSTRDYKDDRASELASFFNISVDEAKILYKETNIDATKKPSPGLFTKHDHASVVDSYLDDIFFKLSITRLMLHYDRFEFAAACFDFLKTQYPNGFSGIKFLEYGAGAADYALTFAKHGATPLVLDLEGGPVEFAAHRFEIRNIPVTKIPVTKEVEYPELPEIDIVNATEVLEHVRNPTRLIFNVWEAMKPGGFLMFSDFPMRKKEVGGSHLPQADANRAKCKALLHLLFTPAFYDEKSRHVFIYKKRDF